MVSSEEFAAVRRGFADYRLEDVIGEGAFGVVLSATQIRMGRRVAIKSLRSDHAHQPEVRRRFATEAQVLGSFNHPHIVDVYDYREDDDFCALVMERLEGGRLRQRLGPWPLRPYVASAVGLTVCSALHYAHGHGVLHRDIKPANLLFGRYGEVDALKLTDFGIAKVVAAAEQPTQAGDFVGTASYMAPEQIEGKQLGPGVDVYGAATLLYEMLSGQLPFSTEGGFLATANRRLYSMPTPLLEVAPAVPPALAEVVMRGLAREPADRPGSAEEFGVAIARVARTSFGPDWLDDAQVHLLAGGAILDAASGRSRAPRPADDDSDTRIMRPVAATPDEGTDERTRLVPVGPPPPQEDGVEGPDDPPGVTPQILIEDPRPVTDTREPPKQPLPDPVPDPETASPQTPERPAWLRRLLIGGAIVTGLIVASLAIAQCSPQADGEDGLAASASPTETSTENNAHATSVSCWDGSAVSSLDECSTPSGLDQVVWMFPSIDDSCPRRGPINDGAREVVLCYFSASSGDGYVRYSIWNEHDDAVTHYNDDLGDNPDTWTLAGEEAGLLWQGSEPRSGVYEYKAAALYDDLPLSFSVYAHSLDDVQHALDEIVSARPSDELQGVVTDGG